MEGEFSERKAELEKQVDDLERAVGMAFNGPPWRAASALPGLVGELIDVMRGMLELIRED